MASAAADDQQGGSFEKTGELTGRVPRPVNRPKQKHAVFRNPRYDFKLGEVVGRDMKITQSLLDMYHDRLPFLEYRASFSKRCRPVFDAIGLCMQGKLTQGECKATEAAWTACAQEWQQHNAMRRQRLSQRARRASKPTSDD